MLSIFIMLSRQNALEDKSILPGEHFAKEYGRAFLRDQESILSKMLSYIPVIMPPWNIAL